MNHEQQKKKITVEYHVALPFIQQLNSK